MQDLRNQLYFNGKNRIENSTLKMETVVRRTCPHGFFMIDVDAWEIQHESIFFGVHTLVVGLIV